ncbi:hypothetical protein N7528_002335 [Penicillium herquei]|nr:hypothetical protein N7528_002335 [Penicillium herquei]
MKPFGITPRNAGCTILRETCSRKEEKITEVAALLCSPRTKEGRKLHDQVHWKGLAISGSPPPLIAASYLGLVQVVEFLLDSEEIDVDSKDWDQKSSLSWAAEYGQKAVVKLLLQTGKADINSKNIIQEASLSLAAKIGHVAVVKLLLQTGQVDVLAEDSTGRDAFSYAKYSGHRAVVDLLLQAWRRGTISKTSSQRTLLSGNGSCHGAVVKLLSDASTSVKTVAGGSAITLI